jgi:glycosyltransferase involved in cell wall biosynthesis
MRLTFIIPLYNRQPFIASALRSLLRQRNDCELDILVINDGSTDDGPDIVNAMARQHGGIRMITTENQGVSRARNAGLKNLLADAELVSFLDSDDLSPAGRIRDDLHAFQVDSSLQFTYGKMKLIDQVDDVALEPAIEASTATVRGISLSAGIYRAGFLNDLGEFDEGLEQAEDTDFLFRAFESRVAHRLTDTICVYYRRHSGNMTRDHALALKCFMRAIHNSLLRRKRNPALGIPSDIFDLNELMQTRLD